jgi:diacylglycerol kinase
VERNGWILGICSALAIGGGFAVNLSHDEWRWIVLAIALVLIAELLNTAVEHLGDAATVERNDHVRHAKDIASGAVLAAIVAALLIGVSVFAPHVLRR